MHSKAEKFAHHDILALNGPTARGLVTTREGMQEPSLSDEHDDTLFDRESEPGFVRPHAYRRSLDGPLVRGRMRVLGEPRARSYGSTHRRARPPEQTFLFQQSAYKPQVEQAVGSRYKKGWNPLITTYVVRMGERAAGLRWMHGAARRYFNQRFQWIGIACIIVNAAAATINIPSSLDTTEVDVFKIISTVLSFLVTIVMAFQQFKDYGSRKTDHATSEANYSALHDHIHQQIIKDSRDRQEADSYVEWISKEMTDLKTSSPMVPTSILQRYREIIDGQNLADPEGMDQLVVKEDSPSDTDRRLTRSHSDTSERVAVVTSDGRRHMAAH